jgi:hypothetical protein
MEEKTINLKLVKYRIRGITKIKDWYGKVNFIEMVPVEFKDKPTIKQIEDNLNDNGFGCQAILGGYITIHEVYENNVELPVLDSIMIKDFTEDDLSLVF